MFPEFSLSERYQEIYPGVGFGLTLISSCREAASPEGFVPEAWTKIGLRTRRCILKGFPYALLYAIEKDDILITVVANLHRDPEHYRNRIV